MADKAPAVDKDKQITDLQTRIAALEACLNSLVTLCAKYIPEWLAMAGVCQQAQDLVKGKS